MARRKSLSSTLLSSFVRTSATGDPPEYPSTSVNTPIKPSQFSPFSRNERRSDPIDTPLLLLQSANRSDSHSTKYQAGAGFRGKDGTRAPASSSQKTSLQVRFTRLKLFLLSTPGKFVALAIICSALISSVGIMATSMTDSLQRDLKTLLAQTEPLAHAAQQLYSSLSIADSAATTMFIAGGIETQEVRQRYDQAISTAATAVTAASIGLQGTDQEANELLAQINSLLPTYTAIISTARANSRAGNPVGAAYLTEASALMQQRLLPRAEELTQIRSQAVRDAQKQWNTPPWILCGAGIITLFALIAGQRWMARRTRRRFNVGYLFANICLVIALLWLFISGVLTTTAASSGEDDGYVVSQLTNTRIQVQRTRTTEMVALVRRDSGESADLEFTTKIRQTQSALEKLKSHMTPQDTQEALAALSGWKNSHTRTNVALKNGDFSLAGRLATGVGLGSGGTEFNSLDAALAHGIEQARERLRHNIELALSSNALLAVGSSAFGLLAILGVLGGTWMRLREFQ